MQVNIRDIINRLEQRKDRNVRYLQKRAPLLLEVLKKPSKINCGIFIDQHTGRIDIQIDGKRMYGGDPYKISMNLIEEFERSGFKFYVRPKVDTTYKDIMMDMRHWHEYLTKAGEDPKVDFVKKPIQRGDRFGSFLCLGIGLGYHIVEICSRYDIKQLIIVERDPEIFKASLFTIDWQFIEKYMRDNRSFNVFINDDPEETSKEVIYYCQSVLNPSLSFDMPVFVLFSDEYYNAFFEKFKERFDQIFSGWGFFQDEIWSLEHTLENITREIPVYYGDRTVSENAKAFVIGAGPSLDNCLDFIDKNKENAVVFSCGSSIGTLYRAGIKPDFHVEIERTKTTYDALVLSTSPEYLSSIPAIYNNPMYPDVSTLFKEKYMFLKGNDTGVYFFPPDIPRLVYTHPTVVNCGISFAINAGFKEIYLFGADMGYRDPSKHHAKGNVALDKNTSFFKEKEDTDYEVEGNFGGKVYSNFILNWARTWIEDLIKITKDVKVFNLSDGAKIKGTIPAKMEEIKLKPIQKSIEIETIKKSFRKDYLNDKKFIRDRLLQLEKETVNYRKYALSQLNGKIKNTSQLMDVLHNIYVWIHLNKLSEGIIHVLLRGGFLSYEHLAIFLCYQKEIRGINFVSETIASLKSYVEESTSMLLNCIENYKKKFL